MKKVRSREDDPLDDGKMVKDSQAGGREPFQDKFLGSSAVLGSQLNEEEDDDIALKQGDVTKGVIDGVLSISFSNKVHSLVCKSMAWVVIVNLPGLVYMENQCLPIDEP